MNHPYSVHFHGKEEEKRGEGERCQTNKQCMNICGGRGVMSMDKRKEGVKKKPKCQQQETLQIFKVFFPQALVCCQPLSVDDEVVSTSLQ